ncbi:MAG: dUTP diphosphatase [Deltaproteobacteria bacterium]|nr:dUTP diphosphatase [Deltaproteobacteria bacterium]
MAAVRLRIKRIEGAAEAPLPSYMTDGASGMDVRASLDEPLVLNPGAREAVPTGLILEVPRGYEVQVRPRSGLALKHGVTCLNTPGTIDSDYRGELRVILANLGAEPFTIEHGDRVAQLVLARVERAELDVTDDLSDTGRGEGGFGHTGKH